MKMKNKTKHKKKTYIKLETMIMKMKNMKISSTATVITLIKKLNQQTVLLKCEIRLW